MIEVSNLVRLAAGSDAALDAQLAAIAAGSRLALILFAVMSGLAWLKNRGEATALERWRRRGWILLTAAVLAASPMRAAILLGYHVPSWAENLGDTVATLCASGCFMCSLAARGFMRGLSDRRVHRGVLVNIVVLLAFLGAAAWLNR